MKTKTLPLVLFLYLVTVLLGQGLAIDALAGTTASYHVRIVRVFGETPAPGAAVGRADDDALQVVVPGDEPWGSEEQLASLARSLDASSATAVSGFLLRTDGAPLTSFDRTLYVGEAVARLRVEARPPASVEDEAHRLWIALESSGVPTQPLAEARLVARTKRTVALAAPSPIEGEWIVVAVTPLDASETSPRVEREQQALEDTEALLVGADGVTTPIVIPGSRVQPVYPPSARKEKRGGSVVIQAIVDEEGRVTAPIVLKTPPDGEDLAASAVDAVSRWRYQPATLGGQPVRVYFTIVVKFRLE